MSAQTQTPRHVRVAVVGGGLSGLAAAIKFRERGWDDFVVLERGEHVGGTWRDNTYPGAACDVPSHLYSYSFAPNPDWSRSFSGQAEIQRYIQGVADRYGVRDKHVFGCEVLGATWSDERSRWELTTTKGVFTADFMVGAWGALCEPSLPDIKGVETFEGHVFHSARWDHDVDLAGKKVAVIGTGASAIQIVPAIAKTVGELTVFQRTAPWLLPRLDRAYTAVERFAYRRFPAYQRLLRNAIFWAHETQAIGLARNPKLMKPMELIARAKLRREVRDPAVRRKLTPDYTIGCKRILLSNEYLPAFNRPNVRLVTDGIAEIRANSIVTRDGVEHAVDALVLATGFHVTDSPTYRIVRGRGGRSLAEVFDEGGLRCYKGTAIAGFPNMFLLVGPNTGLGHNSMIYMIESQVAYLLDALGTAERGGFGRVEVRDDAQADYYRTLQDKLSRSVWTTGGCASWYLDKHGANTTIWPGLSYEFNRITRTFDAGAYHLSK